MNNKNDLENSYQFFKNYNIDFKKWKKNSRE